MSTTRLIHCRGQNATYIMLVGVSGPLEISGWDGKSVEECFPVVEIRVEIKHVSLVTKVVCEVDETIHTPIFSQLCHRLSIFRGHIRNVLVLCCSRANCWQRGLTMPRGFWQRLKQFLNPCREFSKISSSNLVITLRSIHIV